jgi:hypothetical protein
MPEDVIITRAMQGYNHVDFEDEIDPKNPPIDKLMDFFAEGKFNPSMKYYECYKFGYNLGLNSKAPMPTDAVDFMNWTLGGDCEYRCCDEDEWTLPNYIETRETCTTQQVYEAYLEYKKEHI